LRHLSREAIIGMRRRGEEEYEDGGDYYSCGGGMGDDTFSSHASPGCARIGRMLSAPTPRGSAQSRTSTAPY
jgi:hypothetical protein